jgi:hypothetical protein
MSWLLQCIPTNGDRFILSVGLAQVAVLPNGSRTSPRVVHLSRFGLCVANIAREGGVELYRR